MTRTYWDKTTSGINTGVGTGSATGFTGKTNGQLTSGLPSGFSGSIWKEDGSTNDGLPFLKANSPP